MQSGQSVRETSSHYRNLGGILRRFNDMHASVWWLVVTLFDPPSSSMMMTGGTPNVAVQQMLDPPPDPLSRSCLWNVDPASLVLVLRPMKMTHQGLLQWMADSSYSCGDGCPQMSPRDSKSTSCTPGPSCSASSTNG